LASTRSIAGRAKAAVLPEPVWERPRSAKVIQSSGYSAPT
jgi:hypothetical protein